MKLARGQDVVKLDIDGHRRPSMSDLARKLGRAGYRVEWMSECRSPRGRGWHLQLRLRPRPTTAEEVVALQAILGSDLLREACNLHRARMLPKVTPFWRRRWNVLYWR